MESVTAWPPVPALTGLPNWSSNCTVIVPEATPAVSVWAAVVKTTAVAKVGFTVSCWVIDASPLDAAVIVGVPTFVSL